MRTGRERSSRAPAPSLRERFNPWYAVAALVVVVVVGVLIGVLATKGGGKPTPPRVNSSVVIPSNLPGLLVTKPPWGPNNGAKLLPRLQTLGIPELGQEQLAYHIHQHLDIYDDGRPVSVPALIGIHPTGSTFFADLHTHDATGIIHVESATQYDYTLGQLFGQIRDATGNAASFLPRFEALVNDRNWLVHRSRNQNRKDLYDHAARQKLIDRTEAIADEALQLAKALQKKTEDHMMALGIPKAELDRRVAIIFREWADQT